MTAAARTDPGSLTTRERLVGERTVPQLWHENYWFRRHEIAYAWLTNFLLEDDESAPPSPLPSSPRPTPSAEPAPSAALPSSPRARRGGVVVEAGSGEGYGVQMLRAAGIGRVVALDYDLASLRHAVDAYPAVAGRAARANLARLPLAPGCAGAVVSLQVIEHLWTPWEFLAECARVLRPGGVLVVTTPNRPTFSPGLGRGEKPPNPFHIKEYDAAELRDTVSGHLVTGELLGVRHGPRIEAWEAAHGSLVAAQLAVGAGEWSRDLRDLVTGITADDFVLEPMRDDDPRLLDLVLTATREAG